MIYKYANGNLMEEVAHYSASTNIPPIPKLRLLAYYLDKEDKSRLSSILSPGGPTPSKNLPKSTSVTSKGFTTT
jgi:hypothetical protein